MYKDNKGYEYEKIAKRYLLAKGYEILEENYICRLGEIDVIASMDNRLHFIEIKGRIDTSYGYPREAVTTTKQKRIIKAAKYYLMHLGTDDIFCQFDVIEIIVREKIINHIENAFWT